MLAFIYMGLRFIHFGALMLIFGNALYSVWFAPSSLYRLMSCRFQAQQQIAALVSLTSAMLMSMIQAGLMATAGETCLTRTSGRACWQRSLVACGCGKLSWA